MNISPVSYNSNLSLKSNNQKKTNSTNEKSVYPFRYSPASVGVLNGATWFCIGFAFDKACKALFKTNSSNKTSLVVNGVLGLAMGTYTYLKAKKLEKTENIKTWDDFANKKTQKS